MCDIMLRPMIERERKYSFAPSSEMQEPTGYAISAYFGGDDFFECRTVAEGGKETIAPCVPGSLEGERYAQALREIADRLKRPSMPFGSSDNLSQWCEYCPPCKGYGADDAVYGRFGMRIDADFNDPDVEPLVILLRFDEPYSWQFRSIWTAYKRGPFETHISNAAKFGIRFTDTAGHWMFSVPDGGILCVVDPDGCELERRHCRYIDGTKFLYGDMATEDSQSNIYTMPQFAELMKGHKFIFEARDQNNCLLRTFLS